jgi:excisionase family DNA binding protein
MTNLTFNISREDAAVQLGISTRTIDRYVKAGKMHYKKVANKVLLAREEVERLQQDFDLLHQQEGITVSGVRESGIVDVSYSAQGSGTGEGTNMLSTGVELTGVKEFIDLLSKKDQNLEEKNQIIFMLQRKIGEMETQLKQMIALPDHSKEKEFLVTNIQKLELEKVSLEEAVKKEKLFGTIFAAIAFVAVIIFLVFAL